MIPAQDFIPLRVIPGPLTKPGSDQTRSDRIGLTKPGSDWTGLTKSGSDRTGLAKPGSGRILLKKLVSTH